MYGPVWCESSVLAYNSICDTVRYDDQAWQAKGTNINTTEAAALLENSRSNNEHRRKNNNSDNEDNSNNNERGHNSSEGETLRAAPSRLAPSDEAVCVLSHKRVLGGVGTAGERYLALT